MCCNMIPYQKSAHNQTLLMFTGCACRVDSPFFIYCAHFSIKAVNFVMHYVISEVLRAQQKGYNSKWILYFWYAIAFNLKGNSFIHKNFLPPNQIYALGHVCSFNIPNSTIDFLTRSSNTEEETALLKSHFCHMCPRA